ncbi:MAG TPA: hypothetical protein VGG49_11715 [Steroidobacteraceae bacterium]|jgi:hypothetical protein
MAPATQLVLDTVTLGAIWLGILGRFLRGRLLVKAVIISVAFLGLLDILLTHFFLTR